MSMDFKVRTWLWWVLVAVLVTGIGYLVWYSISSSKTVTITTSPSPVQTVTPSPAATATPTAATGETTTGGDQEMVGNKTWEGKVNSHYAGICTPTISFQYPSGYKADQPTYSAGTGPVAVYKEGNPSSISIDTIGYNNECEKYNSPMEYFNTVIKSNSNIKVTAGPTELIISGYSAVQYITENNMHSTDIMTNYKWVMIDYDNSADKEAYDVIINSIKFK